MPSTCCSPPGTCAVTRPSASGLVNRALPADEVLPAAQDYVRQLARSSSPSSMAVMKRQVYTELHAGLGAAERQAIELMVESFNRPDFAEGVQSFLQRRDPNFPRLPIRRLRRVTPCAERRQRAGR